jgi:glycosyltransferase 2 family protein
MIAAARKLIAAGGRNRGARVSVQVVVSVALLYLLVRAAPQHSLAAAWHAVGWQTLLLTCGCYVLATLTSTRRWQLLLRHHGIDENLLRLTEIYFIGLFCSLFLPTSAGGDAYRVFEVSRRSRQAARALLATLQDRLLGLGGMMLIGFCAALWHRDLLPGNVVVAVLCVYGLGIIAVMAVLHCGPVLRLSMNVLARSRLQIAARLHALLEPLRDAGPPPAWCMLRVVGLALSTFFFSVAMYALVGEAVGASCGWPALCLIVSLVAVVRMLPISLGGLGVGEETFVVLIGLFGIEADKAAPIALVVLGVGVAMSLAGGLLLLRRMVFLAAPKEEAGPVILPLPTAACVQGERSAA